MNQSCQSWSVEDSDGRWFGIGEPNQPLQDDQTYYGKWDSTTHQLCIGKTSLPAAS